MEKKNKDYMITKYEEETNREELTKINMTSCRWEEIQASITRFGNNNVKSFKTSHRIRGRERGMEKINHIDETILKVDEDEDDDCADDGAGPSSSWGPSTFCTY